MAGPANPCASVTFDNVIVAMEEVLRANGCVLRLDMLVALVTARFPPECRSDLQMFMLGALAEPQFHMDGNKIKLDPC